MAELGNTYLTFKTGDTVFGVNVANVVEILEYKEPKTRQNGFPYLKGLIEHRNQIVPLIDSGIKFGGEAVEITDQTCTIVINIAGAGDSEAFNIGLVVSQVSDIVEAEESEKHPIETHYKPGYVGFAINREDLLVLVLDTDKVFTDTDIINLKEIVTK